MTEDHGSSGLNQALDNIRARKSAPFDQLLDWRKRSGDLAAFSGIAAAQGNAKELDQLNNQVFELIDEILNAWPLQPSSGQMISGPG